MSDEAIVALAFMAMVLIMFLAVLWVVEVRGEK